MGKSGYLPDISGNFAFYRSLAVNNLQRNDYAGAKSALFNLNGCLGSDYLVTISTKQYEDVMQDRDAFLCNHCTMLVDKIIHKGEDDEYTKQVEVPTEVILSEVKIFNMQVNLVNSILLQNNTLKAWVCPSCNKVNELTKTKKIQNERVRPFYSKVVPEPPTKLSGLTDRVHFHQRFTNWFYLFLEEINWAEVLYRTEYQIQNGHDMEISFNDKGGK